MNSYGDIINSCATGNVYGLEEVGGLTGWNNRGEIMNCYSTGDVNGIEYIGGLSGGISSTGHIINCYVTGKVFGNVNTGGLLGYIVNNQGGLTKSFWDTDKNPDINGVGNVSDPNVIGLPTFLMQMRSTFVDAGWDFVGETANGTEDIWTIHEEVDYPKFVWELVNFIGWYEVDFRDYSFFANRWMDSNCGFANDCDGADLDFSDKVDGADMKIFFDKWMEGVE